MAETVSMISLYDLGPLRKERPFSLSHLLAGKLQLFHLLQEPGILRIALGLFPDGPIGLTKLLVFLLLQKKYLLII